MSRYDCLDRSTRAMRMNREMKNCHDLRASRIQNAKAASNAVIHCVKAENNAETRSAEVVNSAESLSARPTAAYSWAAHCGPPVCATAEGYSRGHSLCRDAHQAAPSPGAAWSRWDGAIPAGACCRRSHHGRPGRRSWNDHCWTGSAASCRCHGHRGNRWCRQCVERDPDHWLISPAKTAHRDCCCRNRCAACRKVDRTCSSRHDPRCDCCFHRGYSGRSFLRRCYSADCFAPCLRSRRERCARDCL